MNERDIQCALYQRHRGGSCVILPNYTPLHWYECDLFVVTGTGFSIEYEIKLSAADFRADWNKGGKHERLAGRHLGLFCPTRFFFAMPEGLVPEQDVPTYAGLMFLRRVGRRHMPVETIVRQAPRLSSRKVPDTVVRHMQGSAYYRFWNERFAFVQYKRDEAAIRAANSPPGDGESDEG